MNTKTELRRKKINMESFMLGRLSHPNKKKFIINSKAESMLDPENMKTSKVSPLFSYNCHYTFHLVSYYSKVMFDSCI